MISSSFGFMGSLVRNGRELKSYQPSSAQFTNSLRAEKSCDKERLPRQLCCV